MTTTAVAVGRTTPRKSLVRNISSNRESVESFVVVFLGFLVLGLQAEGFVIPTGSMAPTLMGRHKEVTCPECGFVYEVDANREVEGPGTDDGSVRVVSGVCVNCRFPAPIAEEPNFQGDRIYVIKTPLSLPWFRALDDARLRRWDVVVFKLPDDPEVRYIKRMVGMPGETLRVLRRRLGRPAYGIGALSSPGATAETSGRNADRGLRRYASSARLRNDPRWSRWITRGPDGWQEHVDEPGVYHSGPARDQWVDLRYRHVLPDPVQWEAITRGLALPHPPRPTLITDFYAYNTERTNIPQSSIASDPVLKPWRQPHWVGDLTLSFALEAPREAGVLRIELVKAGVSNRVEIDLAQQRASLWHGDRSLSETFVSALHKPGPHRIRFSNVDDRLALTVDGVACFGDGIAYVAAPDELAQTSRDLDPAGVAVQGGADVTIRNLLLSRDIYYTLHPGRVDYDTLDLDDPLPTEPVAMFNWLGDPSKFSAFGKLGSRDFPIAADRYMMLGDNSPWSSDGREWRRTRQSSSERESWEVPETLLVGKAFCVWWPHLKPFWPAWRFGRNVRLPARPYLEKLRWVR